MKRGKKTWAVNLAGWLACAIAPAGAEEIKPMVVNWTRLQLTPSQNTTIQTLESQWNQQYMDLEPSIVEDQKKIAGQLADPKSDPLEIMTLQAAIDHKRQQLRAAAMANYLRKRQALNAEQQRQLEDMIRNAIAERQKATSVSGAPDAMADHLQNLLKKMQNIFPGN